MQRGPQGVAVCAAFSTLAGIIVTMRLYCRFGLVKQSGADDYLAVAAFVLSVAFTICTSIQQHYGLGHHVSTLRGGEYEQMFKWSYANIVIYYLGLTIIKSSVIVQLLRFLVEKRVRLICWCTLVLTCTYGLIASFCSLLSCRPIAFFWNKAIQGGQCIDLTVFWYCNAIFIIITDIILVVIPLSVLRSLQLPKRQEYGLLLVFGLGAFACVTSIVRLYSLYTDAHSIDITWEDIHVVTWSAVELNTGIVCACLPTLKPIINIISPRLFGSHSSQPTGADRSIHIRRTVQRSYEGLSSVSLQDRKKQDTKYEWEVTGPSHTSA